MQRSTRHGELKGELRQKVEVTRLQLAMASSKSKKRQEGIVTRLPCAMAMAETHWGRKLNSPWRAHLLARRVESEKKV